MAMVKRKKVRQPAGYSRTKVFVKKHIRYKKINKKSTRTYKERIAQRVARAKARAEAAVRQPPLPLNVDFYNVVDGVYSSY
jgi:hypothetical protein